MIYLVKCLVKDPVMIYLVKSDISSVMIYLVKVH